MWWKHWYRFRVVLFYISVVMGPFVIGLSQISLIFSLSEWVGVRITQLKVSTYLLDNVFCYSLWILKGDRRGGLNVRIGTLAGSLRQICNVVCVAKRVREALYISQRIDLLRSFCLQLVFYAATRRIGGSIAIDDVTTLIQPLTGTTIQSLLYSMSLICRNRCTLNTNDIDL